MALGHACRGKRSSHLVNVAEEAGKRILPKRGKARPSEAIGVAAGLAVPDIVFLIEGSKFEFKSDNYCTYGAYGVMSNR